jgi:hypothetical protein
MLYFCPTYTEDAVCLRHAKRGECCCMLGVTFSDQGHNRVGDHGGHVRKPIPGLIGLNLKHWNNHAGWGNKGQKSGGKAILKNVTNFASALILYCEKHIFLVRYYFGGWTLFSVFHTKIMLKRSKRWKLDRRDIIKQSMKSTHKQVQRALKITEGCQRSGQNEWEEVETVKQDKTVRGYTEWEEETVRWYKEWEVTVRG